MIRKYSEYSVERCADGHRAAKRTNHFVSRIDPEDTLTSDWCAGPSIIAAADGNVEETISMETDDIGRVFAFYEKTKALLGSPIPLSKTGSVKTEDDILKAYLA